MGRTDSQGSCLTTGKKNQYEVFGGGVPVGVGGGKVEGGAALTPAKVSSGTLKQTTIKAMRQTSFVVIMHLQMGHVVKSCVIVYSIKRCPSKHFLKPHLPRKG